MDRRQFLQRGSVLIAGAALLPSLWPTCKECGDRLLISLLSDDWELCSACRAAHRMIHVVHEWPPQYNTTTALQDLFKKTRQGMLVALRSTTPELDWLRRYPIPATTLLPSREMRLELLV